MLKYISLLRGINVSGKNMIKMPELIKVLEKEGFSNVRSYIQSGNLVFNNSEIKSSFIARRIEEIISRDFGLIVPVLVMTAGELSEVISANPFLKRSGIDTDKLHVTFLSEEPDKQNIEKLLSYSYSPDEILTEGKVVYLYLPDGYGRTKFNNTFIENKLGVSATTRNWRTCLTMKEMCS